MLGDRLKISIHAPRTGSDYTLSFLRRVDADDFNPRSPHGERHGFNRRDADSKKISIHAPRTGSDQRKAKLERTATLFQSTLPARGATNPSCQVPVFLVNFNPRSPHGERRLTHGLQRAIGYFNPRSPHGERR